MDFNNVFIGIVVGFVLLKIILKGKKNDFSLLKNKYLQITMLVIIALSGIYQLTRLALLYTSENVFNTKLFYMTVCLFAATFLFFDSLKKKKYL